MQKELVPAESSMGQPRQSAARVRRARLLYTLKAVLSKGNARLGLIVIVLMVGMALAAPLIVAPNERDPYQMPRDLSAVAVPPGTPGHLLGTTRLGGDVLYGVVWGARLSLQLSLYVVGGAVLIGLVVGTIAGVSGGKVDSVLMRFVDTFLSIPELIFPLAIAAILGPSFKNIVVALAVIMWARYARIIRSRILQVREESYVDAARSIGASKAGIIMKDVLPNSLTPVTVQATLDMGHAVLFGATLSFIGLSVAGQAEWGTLVSEGQADIAAGRWWTSTFPGLMVFLWALSFNLVGDGLRDVLDPRNKGR